MLIITYSYITHNCRQFVKTKWIYRNKLNSLLIIIVNIIYPLMTLVYSRLGMFPRVYPDFWIIFRFNYLQICSPLLKCCGSERFKKLGRIRFIRVTRMFYWLNFVRSYWKPFISCKYFKVRLYNQSSNKVASLNWKTICVVLGKNLSTTRFILICLLPFKTITFHLTHPAFSVHGIFFAVIPWFSFIRRIKIS